MTTYKELQDKYLKEDLEDKQLKVWDGVSELYSSSSEIKLLSNPKLVEQYISKWGISPTLQDIIKKGVDK